MLLSNVLYKISLISDSGKTDFPVSSIVFDSCQVGPGSLFVAIPGTQVDGHDFIQKSIESGAIAIICERKPEEINPDVTYVVVANSSIALGIIVRC